MRWTASLLFCAALVPSTAAADRLPGTVVPEHYDLAFTIDLAHERFAGQEAIRVRVGRATRTIVLNALDLDLSDASVQAGSTQQTAAVLLDAGAQTATLTLVRPVDAGTAEIRVRFAGKLNTQLRGLYLSRTARRAYAITQFESTDARRAFPCFDEPSLKATFTLTATVDRGDTVVTNGPLLSDRPGPGATEHTLRFGTSPRMSSYLVAMAVGDFRCLAGSQDRVPIRVCATPEKSSLGRIALDSAEAVLKFYDTYFAMSYPFGKLDLVAVPDFAAGAMENTAAIFFRETDLLADAGTASVAARKNIASTVAHEMAHQWFGDLVTMAWWDDLWLNEGFATWMSSHPLAAWKPEWHIEVDDAADTQQALALDSLKSTHPIRAEVETPAEIEAAFDTITYEKGSAVLRMVEHYVGADVFRRAVNRYLRAHAYGNATSEDFWSAVAAESGRPVDRIIPAFIQQPGVPLVEVGPLVCGPRGSETSATFRQSRFALEATGDDDRLWQIPIAYAVDAARPPDASPQSFLLGERSQTQTIAHGCAPWVFANVGAEGYYRTAYPQEMLKALAPSVLTALTPPERLSLVEDEWALVRAGRRAVTDFLTIAAGFGRETTSGVVSLVMDHERFVSTYLTDATTRPALAAFVRQQFRGAFDTLGIDAGPGESDDRRALRPIVISALGLTGEDAALAAKAREAVDRALAGGPPLEPSAATALVTVAAAHGDAALYDALAAAADRATSPEEHNRYLYALTAFRDPALIERALGETRSRVRSQDTSLYLARFFANPAARDRAWRFVKDSWTALAPKIRIAFGEGRLVGAVGAFCDQVSRDDVRAFFAAHPLPTATRNLGESLERIDNCIALRRTETPLVANWLRTAR